MDSKPDSTPDRDAGFFDQRSLRLCYGLEPSNPGTGAPRSGEGGRSVKARVNLPADWTANSTDGSIVNHMSVSRASDVDTDWRIFVDEKGAQ